MEVVFEQNKAGKMVARAIESEAAAEQNIETGAMEAMRVMSMPESISSPAAALEFMKTSMEARGYELNIAAMDSFVKDFGGELDLTIKELSL